MPRTHRSIEDIHAEFSDDFTIVNGNLLLCKFCDTIVKWRKKTRVIEHMSTKMHAERKESKLKRLVQESIGMMDEAEDYEDDKDVANHPQYCLRWNNHQINMVSVFSRLLGDEQFTDCLIAVDGHKLRAHKLVLSACSSYFEDLFMSFNEKNQIVVLKDTRYCDVQALLEFMYKGEINVPQDQLSSLLRTAVNLKIRGLAEGCNEASLDKMDQDMVQRPTSAASNSTPSVSGTSQEKTSPPSTLSSAAAVIPGAQNNNSSTTNGGDDPCEEHPDKQVQMSVGHSQPFNSDTTPPPPKRKRGRPRTLDRDTTPEASNGDNRGGISSNHLSPPPPLTPLQQALSASSLSALALSGYGSSAAAGPSDAATAAAAAAAAAAASGAGIHELAERLLLESAFMGGGAAAAAAAVAQTSGSSSSSQRNGRESPEAAATPGGPLTEERIKGLGVVKLNDYLVNGTRPQFWEEHFVKVIMHAVKNKEIDVKGAAELLGVSYGTLYGRYRELFGYVKHAWNTGGRPAKPGSSGATSTTIAGGSSHFTKEPSGAIWTDPSNRPILEKLKTGQLSVKQAAEGLGIEPAVLAFQLIGQVPGTSAKYFNEEMVSAMMEQGLLPLHGLGASVGTGTGTTPDCDDYDMIAEPEVVIDDGDLDRK